jgi:hypothetical protein
MKKELLITLVISLSALSLNAEPLKDRSATSQQLEAAVIEKTAALDESEASIKNLVFNLADMEGAWKQAEIAELSPKIVAQYPKANLSPEQVAAMASDQVDALRKQLPEAEFVAYLQEIFNASKAQKLAEIADARNALQKEADTFRKEIAQNNGGTDTGSSDGIANWVAQRVASENTLDRKVVKLFTDISITDIKKDGILGGPNSEARKAAMGLNNAVEKTTGISIQDIFDHGILGGPNSDARKIAEVVNDKIHDATGVSVSDIIKNGPLGGPNSDARKVVEGVDSKIHDLTGVSVSDIAKHGPLGGPNSDARKVVKVLTFGLF